METVNMSPSGINTLWPLDEIVESEEITKCEFAGHILKYNALSPIVKWPGGKEKELKFILPNLPQQIDNYFEPFVGGGSVFMALQAKHYYINDKSDELISLYKNIASQSNAFFCYCEAINSFWINAEIFFKKHPALVEVYSQYSDEKIGVEQLACFINKFCSDYREQINAIVPSLFDTYRNVLISEMRKNLLRKLQRMNHLEKSKQALSFKDRCDNIETAIKSAVYMYYRCLYNHCSLETTPEMSTALFLFIRNYAYSAMFRYNDKGQFNVPYGGIAYNSKRLSSKLAYYHSPQLLNHFSRTSIYNLDFETFLDLTAPKGNDFVFLDPPYDTDFSTYAQNSFSRKDQERLAFWLINKCRSRWMMIIKNTEFIYGLYSHRQGIYIRTFDKKYAVSFMNRNNRSTTHLLITNY